MSRRTWLAISGLATAMLVGASAAYLRIPIGALLVLLTAGLLSGPLIWRGMRREFDPFEPMTVFALAYGVMFVIRPGVMLLTSELISFRPERTVNLTGTFTEMMMLATVGAAGFAGAYVLPAGRWLTRRPEGPIGESQPLRIWTATGSLAMIGIGLFGIFVVSLGGIGGLELLLRGRSFQLQQALLNASAYYVYGVTLLVPASLILGAVGLRQRRPAMVLAAVAIASVVLLIGGPIGSRILLLPLFGGAIIYFYVARGTRPSALALIAVLCAALTASAVILTSREASVRRENTIIDTAVELVMNPTRIVAPLTSGEDAAMAPYLAAALAYIPEEIPHTFGAGTFGDLITRPVPRQMWPEKPISPRERVVSTIWPVEYAYGVANPEFSVLLVFYMDFGVVGVFLGMVGFGIAWRRLYEYFLHHKSTLRGQLVFAVSVSLLPVAVRDSAVDTLIRVILVVIPIAIILRFSELRSHSHMAREGPPAVTSRVQGA